MQEYLNKYSTLSEFENEISAEEEIVLSIPSSNKIFLINWFIYILCYVGREEVGGEM